jgi:hypothetical protein
MSGWTTQESKHSWTLHKASDVCYEIYQEGENNVSRITEKCLGMALGGLDL